jgi:DNA-binding NarL/FixJ family response regulator
MPRRCPPIGTSIGFPYAYQVLADGQMVIATEAEDGQDVGEGTVKVFVAEESAALSMWLVKRLEATPGVTVIGTARTVIDAVRNIVSFHPDLVITDVDLAEGGGFALLEAIHVVRVLEDSGPTVILWTACRDPLRQAWARRLGARIHLDKSREAELLVEYCRQAAIAK